MMVCAAMSVDVESGWNRLLNVVVVFLGSIL